MATAEQHKHTKLPEAASQQQRVKQAIYLIASALSIMNQLVLCRIFFLWRMVFIF